MARFVFTLKLPTFQGKPVQEIIGDYEAKNLMEVREHLHKGQRWFMVEQLYTYEDRDRKRVWEKRGVILINVDIVGKIKVFVENEFDKS